MNNFNVYAGVWNDLWSKQDHPQVGSWNEFDWFVGFGVGFAQYWKVGLQYIVFLSPPGAFRQERNLELAVSFDDGALTVSAFSVNPYVKVFYAISGDSTVVVGKQGGTLRRRDRHAAGIGAQEDQRRSADDHGSHPGSPSVRPATGTTAQRDAGPSLRRPAR